VAPRRGLAVEPRARVSNDAFSWDELTLWFAACVLVFGGSALVCSMILFLGKRMLGRELPGTAIFWALVFVLGYLGPNALSAWFDRCLFTWPASLYAAFHATVVVSCWADRHAADRRARWLARLAFAGLLLVGYGYYALCESVGMFIGWTFLFGFLPAFPGTWLGARAQIKLQRLWIVAVLTLLAFTIYFWSCQALLLWKELRGA